MRGYYVLGGGSGHIELPTFEKQYSGNLVGSRDKGNWVLDSRVSPLTVNLPARDKQVDVWATSNQEAFRIAVANLDASYGDAPYADKLHRIPVDGAFAGAVINTNVSTHGSLGIKVVDSALFVYGLTDTQLKTSYLVWSSVDDIHRILSCMPLRFLLYRFPVMHTGAVFIQGEAICSKWWRWLKTHQQTLHAFNALEMKLYGRQAR